MTWFVIWRIISRICEAFPYATRCFAEYCRKPHEYDGEAVNGDNNQPALHCCMRYDHFVNLRICRSFLVSFVTVAYIDVYASRTNCWPIPFH